MSQVRWFERRATDPGSVWVGVTTVRRSPQTTPATTAPVRLIVWEHVNVPAVGGPVDGRDLTVPVTDDGFPPGEPEQTWLWVKYGGELLDADVNGVYELEPVAGAGPPWFTDGVPGSR